MKIITICALLCGLFLLTPFARQQQQQSSGYEAMKNEAERFYNEGSYQRALDIYARASAMQLSPTEKRWVAFRLADTRWRAQSATQTADDTQYEQARQELENLVRDIKREEDRDRVWAEVQESLGDYWWVRAGQKNWSAAWPFYQQALDWWAGARDVDTARSRYLRTVWRIAQPPQIEPYYYYGYYGNYIPLEVLENALNISQRAEDRAHAHYLIAMTLRAQGGDTEARERIPSEFEGALKVGKQSEWYDDALYFYAETLANYGRVVPDGEGGWNNEPDYARALELYRRLTKEFRKGETRYYDQAVQQIEELTKPIVGVGVGNVFLPDSEIQFNLNWRNTPRIVFALYRINLTSDVNFTKRDDASGNWLQNISLSGREKIKTWSKQTVDKAKYEPGQETLRLPEGKLPVGAYVLEARGVGAVAVARDLILVTDVTTVVKSSARRTLVYLCHALTGAPVGAGHVRLWEKYYDGRNWQWRAANKETNDDGIAVFETAKSSESSNTEIFVGANAGARQAFSTNYAYNYQTTEENWKIYAFTDRPAYRPGDSAQWKFIARRQENGVYTTPANQTVEYEINDPRGAKVKEGKAALNAFGSAWGAIELTDAMPLGEYRITFYDANRKNTIGGAALFRLEEYKLPEYKVSVETPEEDGRKKAFRLGEKVEVNIAADYYFGGAVANATVEVVVTQNPFYQLYRPQRDYPWLYDDINNDVRRNYYGQGPTIKREVIKTDAQGKAKISFDTPRGSGGDYEYRIEARVTDSSRREINASGTVRVTRQRYYVYPQPEHSIYRPQDRVKVALKAIDANEQPIQTEGQVKITRDYWYEVWLDPQGREVKGEELKRERERNRFFPAIDANGVRAWRLKFRGYQHDDIISAQTVRTDATGAGELAFTPEREGYYRIAWTSADGRTQIKAEAAVWVATNATSDLGYRYGGLQIIADKDTFRAGQTAPVMLAAQTSDAYVLFSIEGADLDSYQLIHLDGNVKLLQLPIEEKHVPNIFLNAAMVSDRQLFTDTKQVIVPSVRNFLQVDVAADRAEYQPRQEGTLTVTTRDDKGAPVAAEVALSLVDESVFYIQQEISGDPRQFYFGTKRTQTIQTQSTFQQKSYVRLIADAKNNLIDEITARENKRDGKEAEQRTDDARDEERAAADAVSEKDKKAEFGAGGAGVAGKLPVNGRQVQNLAKLSSGVAPAPSSVARPGESAPPNQEPAVVVRNDFRATTFWQPDITTDGDGRATVKIKYPDSLTNWRATARVASLGSAFGIASTATRTKQPLLVRLQAPRFFLAGDRATISAVINNNTDKAMSVTPSLEAEGVRITGIMRDGRTMPLAESQVNVAANGEARVDWTVSVERTGTAKLKTTVRGGEYSDAMEKSYPVYEHGIEKLVAASGKMRGDDVAVKLDIPAARKKETTTLAVQVTPSMAVTMLDALPYLINYPYGCTEQTMSRFLPAAITAATLRDVGLSPAQAMGKVFGGINRESASETHPDGARSLKQLDEIIALSLARLNDFQHTDGGWGWWKEGESDHYMSAYVVWGLALARDARLPIKDEAFARGAEYLRKEIVEEEADYDEQAWMLHALAAAQHNAQEGRTGMSEYERKAFDNLWTNRDKLNAYTRALLALSAHYYGESERAATLVRNLENGVTIDNRPDVSMIGSDAAQSANTAVIGTAHWGADGIYWHWSEGGVETTSFVLRALLAIDPQNKLIEPTTNWLIKNRRGAQWSNTRDTAITVLALNDYLRTTKELAADVDYELLINGATIATKHITAADALSAPSVFAIDRELIRDGANEIRIRRRSSGNNALYFAAEAHFFSTEEPVAPAGNEIFVRRDYYKLVGRPTLLKGYVYDRVPLADGETVKSGERVETIITIEAKNDYEYLLFEDLKPAGLEAVAVQSGGSLFATELKSGALKSGALGRVSASSDSADEGDVTNRTSWVYQELRDRKVALFISKLPQGVWRLRYDLRAEVPGIFHALPVVGHAMYAPEIRANGAETRLSVVE